jgi:hypothetical protein
VLMKASNGDLREIVIDPSLFKRPATREEWVDISTKHTPQNPKSYVRSAYYYGTGNLPAGESQVIKLSPDTLIQARQTMASYMKIQNERREEKKKGTFPKCDNVK